MFLSRKKNDFAMKSQLFVVGGKGGGVDAP